MAAEAIQALPLPDAAFQTAVVTFLGTEIAHRQVGGVTQGQLAQRLAYMLATAVNINQPLLFSMTLAPAAASEVITKLFYQFGRQYSLPSEQAKKYLLVLLELVEEPLHRGDGTWVIFNSGLHAPRFEQTEDEAQAEVTALQDPMSVDQERDSATEDASLAAGTLTRMVAQQEAQAARERSDVTLITEETRRLQSQLQQQQQEELRTSSEHQKALQHQQEEIHHLRSQQQHQNSLLEQLLQHLRPPNSIPEPSSIPVPAPTVAGTRTSPPRGDTTPADFLAGFSATDLAILDRQAGRKTTIHSQDSRIIQLLYGAQLAQRLQDAPPLYFPRDEDSYWEALQAFLSRWENTPRIEDIRTKANERRRPLTVEQHQLLTTGTKTFIAALAVYAYDGAGPRHYKCILAMLSADTVTTRQHFQAYLHGGALNTGLGSFQAPSPRTQGGGRKDDLRAGRGRGGNRGGSRGGSASRGQSTDVKKAAKEQKAQPKEKTGQDF